MERSISPERLLALMLPIFAAAASGVIVYPELAIRVDALAGGKGGSWSSLGYYRDFYVLPAALAFLVLSSAALALAARRGRRAVLAVVGIAWVVLLVGLVGSVEWYYASVRAASELR